MRDVSRRSFQLYEIVRVMPATDDDAELEGMRGRIGAILGNSGEEPPTSYAVMIDDDECWWLAPEDLEATGVFRRHEDYYDGTSIRVSPDGELLC